MSAPVKRWTVHAPLLVLLLVLLLSLLAALVISAFVREQQANRFERETQVYTQALKDRMDDYERLLRSARAAWLVHPNLLDEAAFSRYVEGVDLARRYPGVQAVGYAVWLPDGQSQALVQRLRKTVTADYQIRQADRPQTAQMPIAVIAPPNEENLGALGFDFYSEDHRRDAIERALVLGEVQVSRRVSLVQRDERQQPLPGFLLMLPVWQDQARKADLQGVIYLAVRADQFLQHLGSNDSENRLFVSATLAGQPLYPASPLADPAFVWREPLTLAGLPWVLNYSASSRFGQDFAASVPAVIMLAGLLVAGLAFMVVQAQVMARNRAEALNVSLGQARLRQDQARAEFEAIFQSMQDAAAFTDDTGRIRLVNRALTDQFGLDTEQIIGQRLGALHLDDRLEGRNTFQSLTTPYRRQDGTQFAGEAQRSEVLNPQGERMGLLEVVRDVSERVAAERAIQAGEERYRGVLDAIPHVLQVSDPLGQVTFRNAQHAQFLGVDDLRACLAPEDLPTFERMWREAAQTLEGTHCEVPLRLQDGTRRWFVLRLVPILAARSEVTEWVITATDVHDRLLAERLAQRNEERYRGVLEGLPQIVWLTDAQGLPIYFNRRWDEYVGQHSAGYEFLNLVHPDDRQGYQQRWHAAMNSTRPFEAEHRLLSGQGAYRTFVTRGLPVLDAQGKVIEWVGTSTDVNDSVFAENSARLLADVSEKLAAPSDDGALHSRGQHYQGALLKVTARFADAAALWATSPLKLLATSPLHPGWETPHMRRAAEQAVGRVIETQDPIFIRAHPLLHGVNATGALLYPLLGRDGKLCGVLGLAYRQALSDQDQDLAQELAKRFASALENDALQRKVVAAQQDLQALNQSLEERVQRRTTELEQANKELEAFSYSVSHDLRTPLRHIVGFGDLLNKEVGTGLSAKGERYLGIITDSASRMSQLIDDLLEFSRMGRQELRSGPVNLGELVHAAWQALEPDRQGRDVRLELPTAWPTVQGDAALLGMVLTNLLSNALKYSRQRDQALIQVRAYQQGGDVHLQISDNGVGFDPKYADKLFGVFQRLHRSDEFEGIGIGLANVRRIVSRHGGQVAASGAPGEGAIFTVTLPVEGQG